MRKLSITILGLVILCGAFIALVWDGEVSDMKFATWVGAVVGLITLFVEGNVRSKKYRPPVLSEAQSKGLETMKILGVADQMAVHNDMETH